MRAAIPCLAATAIALAACQPAPEDGMEEQPSLENIAEAQGDSVDEPGSQGEPAPTADATPLANDKARWFIEDTRAAYGPPESEAMLSLQCQEGVLTARRVVGRSLDGNFVGNMNFLGNGANTLVRVTNATSELGGSLWHGEVLDTQQMARVIGTGDGAVEINIEGQDAILIRPSPDAARFVQQCR